ncbi:MAG: dynamin family protein [Rhodobacteraceae bacterium]|nr:dynamin family protein [Paracoccaceae bacterium]
MSEIMQDQPSEIQAELERKASDALSRLYQADRGDKTVAKAYDAALDLHTLLTRPIKVAIGGEFSSGKSTFVNMLLGQHVVDMQASASAMPTVHFLHGAKTTYRTIGTKHSQSIADINTLREEDLHELECLEVTADVPFLKQFEIFDTPGTSDPSRSVDQLLTVVNQVDFVIWCTNATQAWRESERRMWENLPFELKQRSLLIVTHVDLPSIKPSLNRLMKRIKKDAAPLFKKIIPMELLAASSARDKTGKVTDQAAWEASGGADCLEAMAAISIEVRTDVFQNAIYDLENKIIPVIENLKTGAASFLSYWALEFTTTQSRLLDADNTMILRAHLKLIEGALAFLDGNSKTEAAEAKIIIARLEEAHDFIKIISLQKITDQNIQESCTAIKQLDWEFKNLTMLT